MWLSVRDEAEGMTGGVEQYAPSPATGLVFWRRRTETQGQFLRRVEVGHAEVEVKLLWHVLVWPLRGTVSVDPLKAQVGAGASGEADEVVYAVGHLHAGQLLVELGKRRRVGTVQNHRAQCGK